jgi:hypothetical protein
MEQIKDKRKEGYASYLFDGGCVIAFSSKCLHHHLVSASIKEKEKTEGNKSAIKGKESSLSMDVALPTLYPDATHTKYKIA